MRDPRREHSRLRKWLAAWRRLFSKKRLGDKPPGDPYDPYDPYARRMAPLQRGPKGRSGAAVAEPEDDSYRAFPARHQ